MKGFSSNALTLTWNEWVLRVDAFDVKPGEWLEVQAPSGFGKTTLIRGLAGFQKCEGDFSLNGRVVSTLPPEKRNFGVVFQDQLLIQNLNAFDNAALGIRLRRKLTQADELLLRSAFEHLGISERIHAPVQELSGGERQRVALIRALAFRPDLIILDEPFKGLDRASMDRMLEFVRAHLVTNPVPVIWISHQSEIKIEGPKLLGEMQHEYRQFQFARR